MLRSRRWRYPPVTLGNYLHGACVVLLTVSGESSVGNIFK
jgi:hypothetical protein